MPLIRLLSALSALLLPACQAILADNGEILFVDSQQIDCYGVAPQQCLKVKHQADDNWSLFYSEIEGFDYQAGYRYKLLIESYTIENVPADASSIGYRLLKVLEQNCDGC